MQSRSSPHMKLYRHLCCTYEFTQGTRDVPDYALRHTRRHAHWLLFQPSYSNKYTCRVPLYTLMKCSDFVTAAVSFPFAFLSHPGLPPVHVILSRSPPLYANAELRLPLLQHVGRVPPPSRSPVPSHQSQRAKLFWTAPLLSTSRYHACTHPLSTLPVIDQLMEKTALYASSIGME